jgi:hypothetical protein
MEALTAVSVAALTIYDMCKAVDKTMTIEAIRLEEKAGGRSGHFVRASEQDRAASEQDRAASEQDRAASEQDRAASEQDRAATVRERT